MAVNYERVRWQNAPEMTTPIDAGNLNHMDNGIVAIARELDTELPLMQEQVDAIPTTIDERIEERFGESITEEVDNWLAEHVTPGGSTIVVDSTLSISGAAADAKATGDALATKADASDVEALETELATKADSSDVEVLEQTVITAEDEITSLKEEIAQVIDSTYVTDTASGAIASFPDGANNVPVKSLTVDIEPVQDLHGHDSPWPAGGGVNLLPFDEVFEEGWTTTLNGITATYSKGYMRVTGTNTSTGWTNIVKEYSIWAANVKTFGPGSYVMGGNEKQLAIVSMIDGRSIENKTEPFTAETSVTVRGFYIAVRGGETVDWNVPMMFIQGTDRPTSYTPYSNVCPITGRDSVSVTRTGKNLFDYRTVQTETKSGITLTNNNDGTFTLNGTATAILYFDIFNSQFRNNPLPYGTYTLSGCPSGGSSSTYSMYACPTYTNDYGSGATFTRTVIGGSIVVYAGQTLENLVFRPQIEIGSIKSDFEPYQGETYEIAFPTEAGTVYGGTLDVTQGVLTVDRAVLELNTLTWITISQNRWSSSAEISNVKPPSSNSTPANAVCSMYKNYSNDHLIGADIGICVSADKYIRVKNGSTTETPTGTLVYELATPITVQLIAQQMTTLLGQNNVWSDAGDTDVTYRADTKLYIEKLTAPTEDDMVADHAIAANSFFMVGNNLYRATTAIASGATITVGTNATKLSLSDALNALA